MKKIEHSEEIPEIGFVTWATEKKIRGWVLEVLSSIPVKIDINPQTDSVVTVVFPCRGKG